MTTILRHKETRTLYALLGPAYGMFKSTRPRAIIGNMSPVEESGEQRLLAVCDQRGEVEFFDASLLQVVSIDGVDVGPLLGDDAQLDAGIDGAARRSSAS